MTYWTKRVHDDRGLTDRESVGLQIRALRRRAGLTQEELAEKAQVSLGGLRDLEQCRVTHPRAATLRRLAAVFGLSAAQTRDLIRLGQEGPVLARDLQIGVLGVLTVRVDGVAVDIASEPQRIVLGILAISPGAPVSVDTLVDLVWGRRPPPTAVSLIRTQVSRLRRRLQSSRSPVRTNGVLVAAGSGYRLRVEDDQLDMLAFQRLVDRARHDRDDERPESAFSAYQQAIGLWRGKPLEDLPLQAEPAVAALTRQHQTAVLEYADTASALDRHDEVLDVLHQLTEDNPLHEPAHARLMVALASTGQQVEGVQVFLRLRDRLAHDLGLDPAVELREIHQAILRGWLQRRPLRCGASCGAAASSGLGSGPPTQARVAAPALRGRGDAWVMSARSESRV